MGGAGGETRRAAPADGGRQAGKSLGTGDRVEQWLSALPEGLRQAVMREEDRVSRVYGRIAHTKLSKMEEVLFDKPWLEERGRASYCRMEVAKTLPPGVMGVGRVPVVLRGKDEPRVVYFTEQYPDRIDIFLTAELLGGGPPPLAEDLKAGLQVEITEATLLVRRKGSLEALVHGKFWDMADAEESLWEFLEDDELRISVVKGPSSLYAWPHLLQNVPERAGGNLSRSNDPRVYVPPVLADHVDLEVILRRLAEEERERTRLDAIARS